jgi:hypothetical protein
VIAAFDDFHCEGRLRCSDRLCQLGRRAEGVAFALHNQQGNADRSEVGGTQLIGLSWWVKGIAEREHTGHRLFSSRKVGRDSPSHRFAADEQRVGCARRVLSKRNDPPEAIFQHGRSVRRSPLLLHVREVERPYVDAGLCKLSRNAGYERMKLAGTRAVGKDDTDVP